MDIIKESFKRMYPEKEFRYNAVLKYGGLHKYNANIRFNRMTNTLTVNLSAGWKEVDEEIKIGLIQELLQKMLGKKEGKVENTINMDLYENFIKSLHVSIPKTKVDSKLKESFERVNEKYFYSLVDMPNLVWGNDNLRTLGTYEYQTDTLKVSNIFRDENERVIDYIVYHELLHKKHKFKSIHGRNYSHTHKFRHKEKEFENAADMEELIKHIIRRKKKITITKPLIRKQRSIFGWLRF